MMKGLPQLAEHLSPLWQSLLGELIEDQRFLEMTSSLQRERQTTLVYPPENQVFAAFQLTSPEQVRVVILGQDPYHGPGQAHGLCFSVPPGVAIPPSLKNIYKEMAGDLEISAPTNGDLSDWARQGVLLLNSLLTVRKGEPMSHRELGWEWFTDGVIERISQAKQAIVFILWGAPAQKKRRLIAPHQPVLCAPHPSPLSAHRGFFGSRPFSQANRLLVSSGREPIAWNRLN